MSRNKTPSVIPTDGCGSTDDDDVLNPTATDATADVLDLIAPTVSTADHSHTSSEANDVDATACNAIGCEKADEESDHQMGLLQNEDDKVEKRRQECTQQLEDLKYCQINKYEILEEIGRGAHGIVLKARLRDESAAVRDFALKKIYVHEKKGLPIAATREIKLLSSLNHKNVLKFIDVCRKEGESFVYLVLEFCNYDLSGLLKSANFIVTFDLSIKKEVLRQLLCGLFYLHSQNVIHRDVKPSNVLVTKEGSVKIADFNLSRTLDRQSKRPLTNNVVTLYYRAPELLLGGTDYGLPVDLWSFGLTMAELWTRSPVLGGKSDQDQLKRIMTLCGPIDTKVWPGVEELKFYNKIVLDDQEYKRKINKVFDDCDEWKGIKDVDIGEHTYDLLDSLLTLDPAKRINAEDALKHDFFCMNPTPSFQRLVDTLLAHHDAHILNTCDVGAIKSPPLKTRKSDTSGAVLPLSPGVEEHPTI